MEEDLVEMWPGQTDTKMGTRGEMGKAKAGGEGIDLNSDYD